MVIFTKLQTKDIEQNNGQVAGLPKNPRLWGKEELEVLKTSLVDTPELFEARGILCVPHKGRYVAIGDEYIDGRPYAEIVDIARTYIKQIGGFERFAEWGLI